MLNFFAGSISTLFKIGARSLRAAFLISWALIVSTGDKSGTEDEGSATGSWMGSGASTIGATGWTSSGSGWVVGIRKNRVGICCVSDTIDSFF